MDGQKSVTIEDVARAAGVSRAAVSKVLRNAYGVSDAMRANVQQTIDALGYRPKVSARAMRGATYTLGIEVPTSASAFVSQIINSLTATLQGTPYQVIIAPADEGEVGGLRAIQALEDRQVDGIVAITSHISPDWYEALGRRTPLVLIGRHDQSRHYDTIVNDDVLGAELAVKYLHGLGHARITHLTIQTYDTDPPKGTHVLRVGAYRATMSRLGLAAHSHIVGAHPSEEGARRSTHALFDGARTPPTAIIAGHDELAMGVLRAIHERGLTARDVSVVGYDDIPVASHPLVGLTTITQFAQQQGRTIGQLLLSRIAGRSEPVHEVITPELRVRQSTTSPAPPNQQARPIPGRHDSKRRSE